MYQIKEITKYAILVSVLSTISTIISIIGATEDMSEDIYGRILIESFNSALIILFIEDIFEPQLQKNEEKSFNEIFIFSFIILIKALRQTLNKLFKANITKEKFKELLINLELDSYINRLIVSFNDEIKVKGLIVESDEKGLSRAIREIFSRYLMLLILLKNLEKYTNLLSIEFRTEIINSIDQINRFLVENNQLNSENKSNLIENSITLIKNLQFLVNSMLKQTKEKNLLSLFLYLV